MSEESELLTINFKAMNSDQLHTIQVPKDITIDSLKVLASDFTNIPTETMKLLFAGKSLKNGTKLSEYNISEGQTIIVFKGRPQEANPAPDPEPEPIAPPPRPRVEIHVQNINTPPIDENSTPQDCLNPIQKTLAKLQDICADLQMAIAEGNDQQRKDLASDFLNELESGFPRMMMNANALTDGGDGENNRGRRSGRRRPHVFTHTINQDFNNPADLFRSITSNLTNFLGDIMNGDNNQNRNQNPPQPAPATPQEGQDNPNTQNQ